MFLIKWNKIHFDLAGQMETLSRVSIIPMQLFHFVIGVQTSTT